jgi:antitoxin MazE
MKAQLISIGNSRGIRIPKAILQQCDMSDEVELAVEGGQIILSPAGQKPRKGWREAASRMAAAGDDALLIPDSFADEVDLEWK